MANDTYGAIKLSDANAVGSMLVKKMGGVGYAPKDWAEIINLMGKLPEKTVSGGMANFSDGADDVPVRALTCTVNPNLSGVSSINLMQTKKNLIDGSKKSPAQNNIFIGSTATYVLDTYVSCVLPAGTYTFSVTTKDGTATNLYVAKKGEQQYISRTLNSFSTSFTIDKMEELRMWVYKSGYNGDPTVISSAQVEVGSSASTIEAYTAPTVTNVPLGRTIYGGSADMVTGEGVETYGIIRLDSLPLIKNNTQNNPNGTYFSLDGVTVPFVGWGSGGRDSAMSNVLSAGSAGAGGQTEPNNTFWWNNASTGWRIVWGEPNGGSSLTEFMKWLTDNNVVVGGTLQNSTSFTFDPISAPHTALGTNNLWNDCGDSEVTYRRDIDLALQES